MDLNAFTMQREGSQLMYDTSSSAGDVTTTSVGAHSIAQPVMPTQALMQGLVAFQSLTPGTAMQPHSVGYILPTSSQLLSDSATSSLTHIGSCTVSSAVNNPLQSSVQSGMAGLTRLQSTLPGAFVQPSSATCTLSNRVSHVIIAAV